DHLILPIAQELILYFRRKKRTDCKARAERGFKRPNVRESSSSASDACPKSPDRRPFPPAGVGNKHRRIPVPRPAGGREGRCPALPKASPSGRTQTPASQPRRALRGSYTSSLRSR